MSFYLHLSKYIDSDHLGSNYLASLLARQDLSDSRYLVP